MYDVGAAYLGYKTMCQTDLLNNGIHILYIWEMHEILYVGHR